MTAPMVSMPTNSRPNANTVCRVLDALVLRREPHDEADEHDEPDVSPSLNAMSCAVMVVPMLAPNMTAMAWRSVMRRALTKPMAMTVVAL